MRLNAAQGRTAATALAFLSALVASVSLSACSGTCGGSTSEARLYDSWNSYTIAYFWAGEASPFPSEGWETLSECSPDQGLGGNGGGGSLTMEPEIPQSPGAERVLGATMRVNKERVIIDYTTDAGEYQAVYEVGSVR